MPDLTRLARRLRSERGFTMVIAMGVMLVVMLLTAAAFAAANGDIGLVAKNDKQKQAYAAAEAGIADYLYRLNQDQNFWRQCPTSPASGSTPWIGEPWDRVSADQRVWRTLPNGTARYTIEVLPATGSLCNPADPDGSMIDPSSGTFRIRSTGQVGTDNTTRRTIIATFKRTGFLDYLYFTNLEDQAPATATTIDTCASQASDGSVGCLATGTSTGGVPTLDQWQSTQCEKYWRDGRGSATYPYNVQLPSGTWKPYPVSCTEIVFGSSEHVDGPLHTNDSIYVCGSPTLGRDSADRIEITAAVSQEPVHSEGCSDSKNVLGTWLPGAARLDPPKTNAALKSDATLTFTGATKLTFNATGTVTAVTSTSAAKTTTATYTVSPNTVIYVQARQCANVPWNPINPVVYDGAMDDGCGDVSVSGTYTQNITIGADNDIVVTDDLTHPSTTDAMLGLIANNNVRVAHPSTLATSGTGQCLTLLCNYPSYYGTIPPVKCTNAGTPTANISIQAAILALTGSWTVDRYFCGAALGNLNVTGAIAQGHRGVVGTGNGASGFLKNYKYDNRLKFRSPPKFLDPVNAAWRVGRQVEQNPPS